MVVELDDHEAVVLALCAVGGEPITVSGPTLDRMNTIAIALKNRGFLDRTRDGWRLTDDGWPVAKATIAHGVFA